MRIKSFGAERGMIAREEQRPPPAVVEKAKELLAYLAREANGLRAEGLPISDDFRIDESLFTQVFGAEKVATDLETVEKKEQEFYPEMDKATREEKKLQSYGALFEILKTTIFHKHLGEQFIVVRTSRYDDIENGVDNVLMDRRTGEIVCAFDEVSDVRSDAYQEKQKELVVKNTHGGASLLYGIKYEEQEGQRYVVGGIRKYLPLFILALPPDFIKKGILTFKPDRADDYETKTVAYLKASLVQQIKMLRLARLQPNIIKAIDEFEQSLALATENIT